MWLQLVYCVEYIFIKHEFIIFLCRHFSNRSSNRCLSRSSADWMRWAREWTTWRRTLGTSCSRWTPRRTPLAQRSSWPRYAFRLVLYKCFFYFFSQYKQRWQQYSLTQKNNFSRFRQLHGKWVQFETRDFILLIRPPPPHNPVFKVCIVVIRILNEAPL